MRFLILLTFTVLYLASSLARAANPQVTKRIAVLKQYITFQRVGF